MITELFSLSKLFGDIPPDKVLDVAAIHGRNPSRLIAHPRSDAGWKEIFELRKPSQQPEGDHVVGLTAAHCLTELEHCLSTVAG
ncbi:hypothetical protein [Palleronia sp.]|uniref:hypothetical protein n=1 Tax=Palleronia sp. TaxID=1940284 RepID=UPI0035C7A3DD